MFAASKSGSAEVADAQFNYVTMLLHGDGTNGAQNNTFLDSSTNNFTITRNGNTTQGTFTPYGSNWSNYFGIATSDLKFASNAAFGVGTGNFSIEFFVNISEWAGHQRFFMTGDSGLDAIQLGRPFADSIGLDMNNGRIITYSWVPNIGQWYHIALVRSGTGTNQITLYIDGTSVATGTSSYSVPAKDAFVGGNDWNTDRSCRGYISNMRFSNTARTITVPTSAYTSDANTLILTCQSNRFIDNSSNGFPAIAQGSPSVQRFSPFSPTTAYSTSVIGGSAYFDGSGDSISAPDSSAFNMTSTSYCFETWIYPTTSAEMSIFSRCSGTGLPGLSIQKLSNGQILFSTNDDYSTSSGTTVLANTWSHIACTYDGTTKRVFLNGALMGSTTSSWSEVATAMTIGDRPSDSRHFYMVGYVSNSRIVKGSAVYTSAFTPPTAPLTAISGTSLLLSYTNAGIFDNAMMNDLETVGNAQISTSVKKYGTGSMYFDGSGDALYSTSQATTFLTGDFTLEFWIYFNAVNNGVVKFVYDMRNSGSTTASFLAQESSNAWTFWNGAGSVLSTGFTGSTFSATTWTHVAICRSSGTTKFFVNGTQTNSVADTSSYANSTLVVGARYNYANELNAYIDDLRITKYARYTASFTAPTAAFADKG